MAAGSQGVISSRQTQAAAMPQANQTTNRPAPDSTVGGSHQSVSPRNVDRSASASHRASNSHRSSTFGSFFRTRIDSQSAQQQSQPQQQQQQQQQQQHQSQHPASTSTSSATLHRPQTMPANLPAPMPNPYAPGFTPSMTSQQAQPGYSRPVSNAQPGYHPPPLQHHSSAPMVPQMYPQQSPYVGQAAHGMYQPPPGPYGPQSPGGPSSAHASHPSQFAPPNAPPGGMMAPMPSQPESAGELEAAIEASRASAAEDLRKRETQRKEEEAHYLALHQSEEEERTRRAAEEDDILRQVMEASQREEAELERKRLQQKREEEELSQILLEESRQSALREEEERMQREHAELLERSRREAEQEALERQLEEERQKIMEETAIQESLRELEEEWRRREEAEAATNAHIQQGGQLGSASYWQYLNQNKAYDLAIEMSDRLSLQDNTNDAGPSRRQARPLPPTPGLAALAAGVEDDIRPSVAAQAVNDGDDWALSDDELVESGAAGDDDDGKDPFADDAEAPPTYDEVRTDRPPDAPSEIPQHIRFAPPPAAVASSHDNTIELAEHRPEKSAAHTNVPNEVIDEPRRQVAKPMPQIPQRIESSIPEEAESSARFDPGTPSASTPARSSPPRPLPTPLIPATQEEEALPSSESLSPIHENPPDSGVDIGAESPAEFKQRAMKGTDFGFSPEPFGTTLELEDGDRKTHFPSLIQLRKASIDGSLRDAACFFVVRAPSWKALLRALAWYGNARVEAGVMEVADHPQSVPLRVEVEFVTPSKHIDPGSSVAKATPSAHVSACFSLAIPSLADEASRPLLESLKLSSRALDRAYLRQGATRRVIALPNQAPLLPLDLVRLAQHMHRAHVFSAACPSTSATALHSPRDLHHAVERHDMGYVAKLQRKRRESGQRIGMSGQGRRPGVTLPTTAPSSSVNPSGSGTAPNNRFSIASQDSLSPRHKHNSSNSMDSAFQGMGDESYDDFDEQGDVLDAGAIEVADGDDRFSSSRMTRMRARMRRRLAKRAGDPTTTDADLESWISE